MRATKALEVQRAIASDIVHGRRAPGMPLDETALSLEFKVSRTPIREAIRQLEMSGLVEARPHRSALVRDLMPERLDDMFAVMAELEALCARWSAAAMTTAERDRLRLLHDRTLDLVRQGQREAYAEANDLFHGAIYDGSRNAFLAETTRHVRLRLAPFRRVQFEGEDRLARSFAEHAVIVAAIERQDGAAAEAAMRTHIGIVRQAVDALALPGPDRRKGRGGAKA